MTRSLSLHYRNFGMPLLVGTMAAGVTLLASLAVQGRGVTANEPPANPNIVQRQVMVQLNRSNEGCRWLPTSTSDDVVQVQCGDPYDTELIVFSKDRTFSYRVTVSNAPPTTSSSQPGSWGGGYRGGIGRNVTPPGFPGPVGPTNTTNTTNASADTAATNASADTNPASLFGSP